MRKNYSLFGGMSKDSKENDIRCRGGSEEARLLNLDQGEPN